MFDHLEIRNFKSVEHVELDCRRVNVLIGEPNTGKSNILEALGLVSYVGYSSRVSGLKSFVRCDYVSNLFYGGFTSRPVEITLNRSRSLEGELRIQERLGLILGYANGRFRGGVGEEGLIREQGTDPIYSPIEPRAYSIVGNDHTMSVNQGDGSLGIVPTCKFYRFATASAFPVNGGGFLLPPFGANLLSLLLRDQELADDVMPLFSERGLRLGLRAEENRIEVRTEYGNSNFSHPYHLTSAALQRFVFHVAALRTNSDSLVVLEDPESNQYSNHTEYLAERIALDQLGNQYFVSTHSPHFLLSLLEKASPDDVAVFMTNCYDYRTRLRQVSPDELGGLSAGSDGISDFQRFLADS